MIRYHLKSLMEDWSFQHRERLTIEKIAADTNIHRSTLSKIANTIGYSTTTDIIDRLCDFFDCGVADLMEFVKVKKDKNQS